MSTLRRALVVQTAAAGLAGLGCMHAPARIAEPAALEAAVASIRIPADAPVLVGSGDIADCETLDGAAATATLVQAVLERAAAAAVFTTGDHAYPNGSAEQFRDCYEPTWGAFNAATAPSPGNHDYETPGASGYFDYFELFDAQAGARPTGYYSFKHGTWRIVALNSLLAVEPGAVQVRWLAQLLEAEPADCLLAFWHHPLRSSGFHGYLPWDEGRDTQAFWEVLLRHGADVVVNGHDHLYERFARLDADGRESETGIRQFTVGTGGAELHPLILRRRGSEYAVNDTYGVLVLILHAGSYEWAYIGADGVVWDQSAQRTAC